MSGSRISIPTLLKVGKGTLQNLGIYLKTGGFEHVVLYFGNGLINMFGNSIIDAVKNEGIDILEYKELDTVRIEDIINLAFEIDSKAQAIIGIGGGKVIDTAKYAAYLRKLPFISIPTSASSDGFSSASASLLVNERRTSVPAKMAYGIIVGGVKLLQTQSGFVQDPVVRWLPADIYNSPEYRPCHLLYYTGITRTAKQILAEIVRRMFLNNKDEISLLRQMKDHAMIMYEALQRQDFRQMGQLVRLTWEQNQLLDSGTNPEAVRRQTELVDDLCLGYKLPGAGGGGYLYMVAKDPEAAARIKKILNDNRPNANARFVDMSLSDTGLQISRS